MTDLIDVTIIPTRHIETVWNLAAPFLGKALDSGSQRTTLDELFESLISGERQLWMIFDGGQGRVRAAVVTEIIQYPVDKACQIVACGGYKMKDWLQHLAVVEDYAQKEGCTFMEVAGRPGWENVLPGYVKRMVILEKSLVTESV